MRLLKPGGRLVIAHFDYLAEGGNLAAETEKLILGRNPEWPWAGSDGRYERWRPHLQAAGFSDISSFSYDELVPYSREAWRGRMRACNGVIALGDPEAIAAFDRDLGCLLEDHPEPLLILHRVFAIYGRAP